MVFGNSTFHFGVAHLAWVTGPALASSLVWEEKTEQVPSGLQPIPPEMGFARTKRWQASRRACRQPWFALSNTLHRPTILSTTVCIRFCWSHSGSTSSLLVLTLRRRCGRRRRWSWCGSRRWSRCWRCRRYTKTLVPRVGRSEERTNEGRLRLDKCLLEGVTMSPFGNESSRRCHHVTIRQ